MPRFSSRNRVKRFTVSTITDPLHTFSYISPKQTKQFPLSTNNKNLSVYAENFYAFLHVAAAILFKSARYRFTRLVRKRVDLISIRRLQLRREIKGYPGSRPVYVMFCSYSTLRASTRRVFILRERERERRYCEQAKSSQRSYGDIMRCAISRRNNFLVGASHRIATFRISDTVVLTEPVQLQRAHTCEHFLNAFARITSDSKYSFLDLSIIPNINNFIEIDKLEKFSNFLSRGQKYLSRYLSIGG